MELCVETFVSETARQVFFCFFVFCFKLPIFLRHDLLLDIQPGLPDYFQSNKPKPPKKQTKWGKNKPNFL
jgi:hypothetical protein